MKRSDIKHLLRFCCDLLAIDQPALIFWNDDRPGKYYPDGRLYLNDKKEDLLVVFTLFHELRHAYQIEALHHRDEPLDVIVIWNRELSDYIPGGSPGHSDQAIEVDAHAFASLVILYLYHVLPEVPGVDPLRLRMRIEQLSDDFTGEEVLTIANNHKIPEVNFGNKQ